jgi:NIPSNAP
MSDVLQYQLRRYKVKPGAMDDWVREWRDVVYPLRVRFGFAVVGAWIIAPSSEFLWILAYDGPDDWAAAEERYYSSPERRSMDPDPSRHLLEAETVLMAPALPPEGTGRH